MTRIHGNIAEIYFAAAKKKMKRKSFASQIYFIGIDYRNSSRQSDGRRGRFK